MNKKILQTIIYSFITLVIMTQTLSPFQVSAAKLNWDNPNGPSPYSPKASDFLNPQMLVSVVGCTGVVNRVANGIVRLENLKNKTIAKIKEKAMAKVCLAATKVGSAGAAATSSTVVGTGSPVGLAIARIIAGTECPGDSKTIKPTVEATVDNASKTKIEQCFNGIAIRLAKNQLTAMTKSTLNWVNTGFNGDPFFVKNTNNLLDDINKRLTEEEINYFGKLSDKNGGDYPYGRDYARSQVNAYKASKDTYGALKQDLTNYLVPGATPDSFAKDFSQGGWDGWLALTQHPQNNPLGFVLKATENLQAKKDKEIANKKEEIANGNGYQDQKKCVEYEKIVPSNTPGANSTPTCNGGIPKDELLPGTTCIPDTPSDGATNYDNYNADGTTTAKEPKYEGPLDTSCFNKYTDQKKGELDNCNIKILKDKCIRDVNSKYVTLFGSCNIPDPKTIPTDKEPKCLKWETITPGSTIAEKAKTATGTPERQIEMVKTINDALNSLFSSLLSNLYSQGMSGLSNVSKTNSIEDLNLDTGAGIGLLTQNSSQTSNPSTFNPSVGLGNKYTEAVNGGDWDAMGNIPTLGVNIGKKNTYYTVSTSGDTKLLKNNHHWQIGEKAFYDGTTWHVGIPKYVIDTRGGIQMQHDFNTTAQTAIKILPQVSPVLGELDYCIPGPNSNWTENSNDTKDAFSNYVDSIYTKDATRMVCDKLNLCITKHTEHFSILSIAPPIQYQSYFSSLPDLWAKITKSELFNTVIKPNEEILPEVTDAEKEYIKKATDNLWSEYTQKINSVYGPNQSGMQSELLTDNVGEVSPNPKYLKMATTGLVMTRNMVQQIDDLDTSTKQYQDDIAVNNANIYKLNVIKDKINAIVSVAQIRRANRRNTDHLSKLPQICLDNEKITWVDNDILKY